MPRARDLGCHDAAKARPILLQQDAVVEDAGGVDDSAKRRHRALDLAKNRSDLRFDGNVDLIVRISAPAACRRLNVSAVSAGGGQRVRRASSVAPHARPAIPPSGAPGRSGHP